MMELAEQFLGIFASGVAIGSAVTYWVTTREKRTIERIRRKITWLAPFHGLTQAQYQKVITSDSTKSLASDEQVLKLHVWAEVRNQRRKKIDPITVAAEIIICEKLLGLTAPDAFVILRNPKGEDGFEEVTKQIRINPHYNGLP